MPLTAIAVGRLRPRSLGVVQGVACGVILVAGGLAALALMPRAGWGWTIPPQILVGAGLGLTVAGLTELALRGRADQVVHGGWTLAARHAGVVLGLLLLAPVLTSALDENRDEAIRAGAAVVLDSEIPPLDKLGVAQDVLAEVDRADEAGELPDVERAFADRPDDDEWRTLAAGLQDQLDRAVTSAFSGPFLLAAALTLCALVPVVLPAEAARVRRFLPLLVALALVARRDRAVPRARRRPLRADAGRRSVRRARAARRGGARRDDRADRAHGGRRRRVRARCLARGARARAAQRGGVRRVLGRENGLDRDEAEQAIHDGLVRAVDDAEEAGALPGLVAPLVRKAAESVPPWLILETLERLGSFLPG